MTNEEFKYAQLKWWKENSEKDRVNTPSSILNYINELESLVKKPTNDET